MAASQEDDLGAWAGPMVRGTRGWAGEGAPQGEAATLRTRWLGSDPGAVSVLPPKCTGETDCRARTQVTPCARRGGTRTDQHSQEAPACRPVSFPAVTCVPVVHDGIRGLG